MSSKEQSRPCVQLVRYIGEIAARPLFYKAAAALNESAVFHEAELSRGNHAGGLNAITRNGFFLTVNRP